MVYILLEDDINSCMYTLLDKIKDCHSGEMYKNIRQIKACGGIKNLYKYMCNLSLDANDLYIVFVDYVYDNNIVIVYYSKILDIISQHKKNFVLFNMICFEHMLLSMSSLLYFINNRQERFQNEFDYLCLLRDRCLEITNKREHWYVDDYLCTYIKSKFKDNSLNFVINNFGDFLVINTVTAKQHVISIENVVYYLLKDITSFSVFKFDKCRFSECWYEDCCTYKGFAINEAKNKCNLFNKKMRGKSKLYTISTDTKLSDCFESASRKYYKLISKKN